MEEYELLDSGEGEKLERFGRFVLRRPDPQAVWKRGLLEAEWNKADATFDKNLPDGKAGWSKKEEVPSEWQAEIGGIKFSISLSGSKHVGVFPEHRENWKWIQKQVTSNKLTVNSRVLNLFGYTGGATLALAKVGAEVTHVDASKISVAKARENAKLNNLEDAPIRWIVDDVNIFLKREINRQKNGALKYDGVVLDPPSFGRGAKGEVWKIEEGLVPLIDKCKEVLSPKGFILLNGYAEGFSDNSYAQILASVFGISLDKVEFGKLAIIESNQRKFILPAGIYARFSSP